MQSQAMLPKLKADNPWLKEINSQSLQCSLQNLEKAYKMFFKKLAEYPRFHKKQGRQSFTVPQHFLVLNNWLKIPKLKSGIRVRMHRPPLGKAKTLTIIKETSGKYYVSIVCECEPVMLPPTTNTVGVDLGLNDIAVLSSGEKINHPRWFYKIERRLARKQRQLSRRKKGSKNRQRARLQVALLHEKIKNQRQDFLHKLSHRLIIENQEVSIEGLRVRNMTKNRHLAKAISDSGWAELARQLQYKANWYGRTVKVIDTFAPSSKKCSVCGFINRELKLSQRIWECPNCKTVHDRDINAAVNIEQIGRDTPELTPVERRASTVSTFSIKQALSKKQETLASNKDARELIPVSMSQMGQNRLFRE